MKFDIPTYVQIIIDKLIERGYEAYIAGGSIRDMLLGKLPNDYDIATNAVPDQIKDVFVDFKSVDIGKKFGTIVIIQEEGEVEITTFRRDGKYIDGRKPQWISFSSTIEEDLSRRDFTINAIAYNDKGGIVDPYGGRIDLKKGMVKTVGCPEERFGEDYLRILRAIRFATQLGFDIDKETFNAGIQYGKNISKVSMERISDELFKIILSDLPSNGIRLLENMGILKILLPEIIPSIGFDQKNPHHTMDVYEHTLCVLDKTPPVIHIRLAALFHDIAKPQTLTMDEEGIGHYYGHDNISANIGEKVLRRFKASNGLIDRVSILVKEHMNHHWDFKEKGLKRLIRRVGKEEIFDLLTLQKADIRCSGIDASIKHIVEREKVIESILKKREAYDLRHIDITGNDLMNLGYRQGPIIGKILEYLLEVVMEKPGLNDKRILMEKALKKFPL